MHTATQMKRRYRPRPDATQIADPTPERLAKAAGDVELGDDKHGHITITLRDAPLERAFRRQAINKAQYDAGAKYRHHWYHGGLCEPLHSLDLNRIFGSDPAYGMARTEAQHHHRQQIRRAVEHLMEKGDKEGKTCVSIIDSLVLHETPLEQVGARFGWGSKAQCIAAATVWFQIALGRLAQMWGIA